MTDATATPSQPEHFNALHTSHCKRLPKPNLSLCPCTQCLKQLCLRSVYPEHDLNKHGCNTSKRNHRPLCCCSRLSTSCSCADQLHNQDKPQLLQHNPCALIPIGLVAASSRLATVVYSSQSSSYSVQLPISLARSRQPQISSSSSSKGSGWSSNTQRHRRALSSYLCRPAVVLRDCAGAVNRIWPHAWATQLHAGAPQLAQTHCST